MLKNTLKGLGKLGLAIFLVAALAVSLWFSSPYFRAWVKQPMAMYHCTVKRDLPGEWCMGLVLVARKGD